MNIDCLFSSGNETDNKISSLGKQRVMCFYKKNEVYKGTGFKAA